MRVLKNCNILSDNFSEKSLNKLATSLQSQVIAFDKIVYPKNQTNLPEELYIYFIYSGSIGL
jgi:hypothetical protein